MGRPKGSKNTNQEAKFITCLICDADVSCVVYLNGNRVYLCDECATKLSGCF